MTRWPTWPAEFRFAPMHEPWCREERVCFDRWQGVGRNGELTNRVRTELEVPVPSVRDALGQHNVARVLRRANYQSRPPYHPDRKES